METPTEEPIYTYTSEQAVEDGILVQTATLLPADNGYTPQFISHLTTNLLVEQGYFVQSEDPDMFGDPTADYKRASIIDLLQQAVPKIIAALKARPDEWLVTNIMIKSPAGEQFEAWAGRNEQNRWTLHLPEDY